MQVTVSEKSLAENGGLIWRKMVSMWGGLQSLSAITCDLGFHRRGIQNECAKSGYGWLTGNYVLCYDVRQQAAYTLGGISRIMMKGLWGRIHRQKLPHARWRIGAPGGSHIWRHAPAHDSADSILITIAGSHWRKRLDNGAFVTLDSKAETSRVIRSC